MAKRKQPQVDSIAVPRSTGTSEHLPKPDVIVDFIFEDGLLYISIENIGERPAHKVSTKFNKAFHGVGGAQEMPKLALFKNIAFLAPKKKITTFLDTSTAYFSRKEPTDITATVFYLDEAGTAYKKIIGHDLKIYTDIGYVKRR